MFKHQSQNITPSSTFLTSNKWGNHTYIMLTFPWPISSQRPYARKQTTHNIFSIFLTVTNCQLFLCTYTKHTYSRSGCHHPIFILGPFLLGGGDTSTTPGDGGGTSTTHPRGQFDGDNFLLTTTQKNRTLYYYALYNSAQFKHYKKVTDLPWLHSQTC